MFLRDKLHVNKQMREYQQKHIVRTLLYSRISIIILFLLCMLLLRSIMQLNDKRIDVAKLRNDSATERANLESKVKQAQLQNDAIVTPRGFENYVRTTFPVVKEGEGVIVIYDDEKSPVSQVRASVNIWEQMLILWNKVFKR